MARNQVAFFRAIHYRVSIFCVPCTTFCLCDVVARKLGVLDVRTVVIHDEFDSQLSNFFMDEQFYLI